MLERRVIEHMERRESIYEKTRISLWMLVQQHSMKASMLSALLSVWSMICRVLN